MNTMTTETKQSMRKRCRELRKALSLSYQKQASQEICTRIFKLSLYQQAQHIALYCPIQNEVDLSYVCQKAFRQGKYCYFPVITEDSTLLFVRTTPQTPFKKNRFGILEPQTEHA
jgi:5-formyltetrahydrofolate cyclo-ligase